ncbi:MAG: type II 3-dehydroquinate dehydratase [Elusimicrobiota bacterium]|jgi:3-dehydroquinate dehydratase-2|nr:type II 3-dehydroquinate dehydratase [Elusimicrobiota bacterium]
MKKILIINGPNINLLGKREPAIYGNFSLQDIENKVYSLAKQLVVEVEFFQSNCEGKIVDKIQGAAKEISSIIINPAAFTHTSIAIRDALCALNLPIIEVHVSNIYAREEFRHKSFVAPVAVGQITGLGVDGYLFALQKLSSL